MWAQHTPMIVFSLTMLPKNIVYFQKTEYDNIDNNFGEYMPFIGK